MDAERIVLVHDWLTGMRGGEKCLEPLARRWPQARLLTLLHKRGSVSPTIEQLAIQPSALNRTFEERRRFASNSPSTGAMRRAPRATPTSTRRGSRWKSST